MSKGSVKEGRPRTVTFRDSASQRSQVYSITALRSAFGSVLQQSISRSRAFSLSPRSERCLKRSLRSWKASSLETAPLDGLASVLELFSLNSEQRRSNSTGADIREGLQDLGVEMSSLDDASAVWTRKGASGDGVVKAVLIEQVSASSCLSRTRTWPLSLLDASSALQLLPLPQILIPPQSPPSPLCLVVVIGVSGILIRFAGLFHLCSGLSFAKAICPVSSICRTFEIVDSIRSRRLSKLAAFTSSSLYRLLPLVVLL